MDEKIKQTSSKLAELKIEEFKSPPEWKAYGHVNEPLGDLLNEYVNKECRDDDGICDLGDIRIVRRIGSDSSRAMVFHTQICSGNRACKLLLATETNPESKNLDEIYITTKLGAKYPRFFTKVYTIGKCSNVNIPAPIKNNELIKEAEIWHIRSVMLPFLNISKRDIKTLEIEYRKTFNSQIYYGYLEQTLSKRKDQGIFTDQNLFKLPALIMCSELGFGDLKQWSSLIRGSNDWKNIINDVLQALEILKTENITHSDLHHGNILLVEQKDELNYQSPNSLGDKFNIVVKIIDFGEFKNEYIPGVDLEKFLEGFNYIANLPEDVIQYITYLKNNIYTVTDQMVIDQ
jgi:serine/threonine protein kinase